MGVNLKDLLVRRDVSIPDLAGRKLVMDGNNILYQFLATIRQPDGTPLKDSHGCVTSHLNGLFHRTTRLMHYGIRPVFVFDGEAPELKKEERARRAGIKKEAQDRYDAAKREGDTDAMRKYGMRTSRLTRDMIDEAVSVIEALGLPVVMAPSEGEAQAAFMVRQGDIYAEISQDYDCLLFGVPRMVQNLTVSERKKKKDKLSYERVRPCMLELDENLESIGISQEQLIALGMLVGTDYNVGGIKGIGPKKALDLVKSHGDDLDALFREAGWAEHFDVGWKEVFRLFTEMPVKKDYTLEWRELDHGRVVELLCDRHDFSNVRVEESLRKLKDSQERIAQKGLGDFF